MYKQTNTNTNTRSSTTGDVVLRALRCCINYEPEIYVRSKQVMMPIYLTSLATVVTVNLVRNVIGFPCPKVAIRTRPKRGGPDFRKGGSRQPTTDSSQWKPTRDGLR